MIMKGYMVTVMDCLFMLVPMSVLKPQSPECRYLEMGPMGVIGS